MPGKLSREMQIVLQVQARGTDSVAKLKDEIKEINQIRQRSYNTTVGYEAKGLGQVRSELGQSAGAADKLAQAVARASEAIEAFEAKTGRADLALATLASKRQQLVRLKGVVEGLSTTSKGRISAAGLKESNLDERLGREFRDVPQNITSSIRARHDQAFILDRIERALREVNSAELAANRTKALTKQADDRLIDSHTRRLRVLRDLIEAEEQAARRRSATGRSVTPGFREPERRGPDLTDQERLTRSAERAAQAARDAGRQRVFAGFASQRAKVAEKELGQEVQKTAKTWGESSTFLGRYIAQQGNMVTLSGRGIKAVNESRVAWEKQRKELEKTGKEAKKVEGPLDALKKLVSARGGFLGELTFATGRLGFYALAAAGIYNMANAMRYGITQGIQLEKVLDDIQSVVPSRNLIARDLISETVVKNAREFGLGLTETAEAAKTFAQTGRTASQIARDLRTALLAARGANLDLEQAKNLIIAIENITDGELEALEVLDRISRVESQRAVTANDLAVAFQRLGPLVKQLKGDTSGLIDEFDVAIGAVTTLVERTRVTGNNAATSLRFILSRLGRPEIVKELQALTGIQLARGNGTELRPYQEILEEISLIYQQLQGGPRSGTAFQLLSVLGGARQLQATAALLEDFAGTTLETATISALGFNDSLERTQVSMGNIATEAQRLRTSFSSIFAAFVDNSLIGQGIAGAISSMTSILDGVSQFDSRASSALGRIARFFGAESNFAFQNVDFGSIDATGYSKLTRLSKVAADANLSLTDMIDTLRNLASGVSEELPDLFGGTLDELLALTEDKELTGSLRGLRDLVGLRLAEGLAETNSEFAEFEERLNNTTDEALKTEIQTERIARAYEVLGDAVFASTAGLTLNQERFRQHMGTISERLNTDIAGVVQNLRDLDTGDVRARIDDAPFFGSYDQKDLADFRELMNQANQNFTLQKFNDQLRFMITGLFEGEAAVIAWGDAVYKVFTDQNFTDYNDALLLTLDEFARSYLQNAAVLEEASDRAARALSDYVAGQGVAASTSVESAVAGQKFANVLETYFQRTIEKVLAMNNVTGETRDGLRKLLDLATSAESGTASFLQNIEIGFVRVKQELFELLSTFVVATQQAENLSGAYSRVGIGFELPEARLSAATALLDGLAGIELNLTKEAASLYQQANLFSLNLSDQIAAAGIGDAPRIARLLEEEFLGDEALGALPARSSTSLETLRAEYTALSQQLQQIGNQNLQGIFGGSQEGRALLAIFGAIASTVDATDRQVLINIAALKQFAEDYTRSVNRQVAARKLELASIKASLDYTKQRIKLEQDLAEYRNERSIQNEQDRAQIAERIASVERNSGRLVSVQLDNIARARQVELATTRESARIRENAIVSEAQATQENLQRNFTSVGDYVQAVTGNYENLISLISDLTDSNGQLALDVEKINDKFANQEIATALGNIVTQYAALSQQIQANVDSATTGLQSVLASYEAFTGRGALRTVLSPIADTFLTRTADNFVKSLFDTGKDTFLGNIAEAFGAGPETRLRDNLQLAFQVGGDDFNNKLRRTFNEFLQAQAVLLGSDSPGKLSSITTAQQQTNSTTRALVGQAATLASSLAVTAIAANSGLNGPNANLGAGLGSGIAAAAFQGSVVAGPVGAVIGGLLGGLIGSSAQDSAEEKQLQALNKIEYNTGRSATVLELERQFLDVARGVVNVPSAFNLPAYVPGAGAQISQTNEITVQVTVQNPSSGQEVVDTITTRLGPALTNELRNLGL